VLKTKNALEDWELLQATQQQGGRQIYDCEEMTMQSGIQLSFVHHVLTEMLEKERSLPAAWQCKTSYHTTYKNCSHQSQDRSIALPTCSPNTSPPYLDLFPNLKELLPGQYLQCLETRSSCVTLHIRHLKSSGQLNGTHELLEH
jgi:hypothetical protein